MFHVGLRENPNSEVDYQKLTPKLLVDPSQTPLLPTPIPHIDENTVELPKAPEGFAYHRVETGDTLVSLSVKYNISVNRLRSFNSRACFDHRLTHIRGQLLLIPLTLQSKLTPEILNDLNEQNDNLLQNSVNSENGEQKEPDDNGKYQLRKAFQFYTKIDPDRANYYLGESNWHLRNAINLYQNDSKWEKQNQLSRLISCTFDEAKSLLEVHHWNVDDAYRYWLNHGNNKKINKNNNKNNTENNTKEQELTSMNNDENQPEFSHSDNTPMQRGICC